MSFIDGLLGISKEPRATPQDLCQRAEDGHFIKQYRKQLEEADELSSLEKFRNQSPAYHIVMDRPQVFDTYIGQDKVKEILMRLIEASLLKNTHFPHTLFSGPAGCGKTTIAYLISKHLDANFIETEGRRFDNWKDIFDKFNKFKDNKRNILFIDEIHSIKGGIQEQLYKPMEEFKFEYTTMNNEQLKFNLPLFTVIGATTDHNKLKNPMLSRFQNKFYLESYTEKELGQMIYNYYERLGCSIACINPEIINEITRRSKNIARNAINFAKNIYEYRIKGRITIELVRDYFDKMGIDKEGLTRNDRKYLMTLFESPNMKAGLNTIIKSLEVDKRTIEQEIEPYLLRRRYIIIAPGGRQITEKGFNEGLA